MINIRLDRQELNVTQLDHFLLKAFADLGGCIQKFPD
jgi:hypothetical protein